MEEDDSEELFDEDLEEEILEEKSEEDEEFSQDSEKVEDEDSDDEIFSEEKNYRNSKLNEILSNPWKNVSLDKRDFEPKVSLEMNLDSKPIKESSKEEKINYIQGLGNENEKGYQPASIQGKMQDKFISESEKILEEQKMLYRNPKDLRPEIRKVEENEKEFISPEDTMKSDYLTKKKFF